PCAVAFHTDSKYLRDGISTWVAGWKRRQWRTSGKKPVKNEDLWRVLDDLTGKHKITWHWVKGHAGHLENERCDALAVVEIAKIKARLKPDELKVLLLAFKEREKKADQLELL